MKCLALVTLEQIDAIGEHLFEWAEIHSRKYGDNRWGWTYKRSVREVTEWAQAQGWPVSYSFVRRIQKDWGAVRGEWEEIQERAADAGRRRKKREERAAKRRKTEDRKEQLRQRQRQARLEYWARLQSMPDYPAILCARSEWRRKNPERAQRAALAAAEAQRNRWRCQRAREKKRREYQEKRRQNMISAKRDGALAALQATHDELTRRLK